MKPWMEYTIGVTAFIFAAAALSAMCYGIVSADINRDRYYEESMTNLYTGWIKITGNTNFTFGEWRALRNANQLPDAREKGHG